MQFNINVLDRNRLELRAFTEAQRIFDKESTRRGRTLQEVREACLTGHAAELYLIDHCGFIDDPREYKDLFDTLKVPVEIKVTGNIKNVEKVLSKAAVYARDSWRNHPNILYIFIANMNGDYKLHGIYNWNGKKFVND